MEPVYVCLDQSHHDKQETDLPTAERTLGVCRFGSQGRAGQPEAGRDKLRDTNDEVEIVLNPFCPIHQ